MPTEPQPVPPLTRSKGDHRRHDVRNTLTHLRLRTQLLHRLADNQQGADWQCMAVGLAAIDESISTLVVQIEQPDGT